MSGDIMEFPETVEEFMEEYKMVDKHEIYSNGTEYVPIFRMEQWFEHCKAHSANNVEVVRCNDCKWNYIHVTSKGHDYHICRLLNLAFDNDDNFFCAYGEKRNECGEPIPHWRGQMDGCLPFQTEVDDEQIH